MSNVIGHATLNVVPSTKGFGRALNNQARAGGTSAGKSGGSALGAGLLGGVAGAAARFVPVLGGALAGVAGLKAIIGGGIDRLLNIEDAQAKLRALGHDAAGVSSIMDSALASVKGTAFGLGDAASIAASAVAAGVPAGQELTRYLSLVGDAATIAGVSLGDMSGIFGKVQASGRLMTGELNQMTDRGLPVLQWLAEEYGVTADAMRDMVSDGAVDSATFANVIEKNIGGAALESGNTTRGAFANMQAALSRLGATLVGPAFSAFQPLLVGITGMIDGLDSAIQSAGPGMASFFGPLAPAFRDLGAALVQLLPNLSPLGIAFQALAPVLPQIGDLLAQIATILAENLTVVAQALTPVVQVLADVLSSVLAAVLPVIATLFEALAPIITTAATIVASLVEAIAPLIVQLAELLIPVIEMLMPVTETAFTFIGDVIKVAMDLIQGILDSVMMAIDGNWSGAWANIGRVLGQAWEGILRAVDSALGSLEAWFRGLWPSIQSWLGDVGSWLYGIGEDLINGLLEGIGSMAGAIWEAVNAPIQDAVNGVKDWLGIRSPSRMFIAIGEDVGEGMVIGLRAKVDDVDDAYSSLIAPRDFAADLPAIDVSDSYMAQAAAKGTMPDLGAPQFTTNYYDNSTSTEDKQAKLRRAQTVLESTVAAKVPRR